MGHRMWTAVAVLLAAFMFAAVASDHASDTVRVEKANDGFNYLVNGQGQLLYYFIPSGTRTYRLSHNWPEPSRSWVELWDPVFGVAEQEFTLGSEFAHVLLEAIEKKRDDVTTYQVYWGGSDTGDQVFWGLYSFAFDSPLSEYDMYDDPPPGWVPGLFEPALVSAGGAPEPMNPARLADPIGGGVGNQYGGGP